MTMSEFYVQPRVAPHMIIKAGPNAAAVTYPVTASRVANAGMCNRMAITRLQVGFSYDVEWKKSDIQWASRWDIYLSMGGLYNDNVHWSDACHRTVIPCEYY